MNKRSFARRLGSLTALVALVSAVLWQPTLAQTAYPSKPVKVVVPFPAGTSPDLVARFVSQKLTERLGQSFVVDNRAGAAGLLAAEVVAKSPADGYTLFFTVNSVVAMNQFIYKKLPYDPVNDFAPVSLVSAVPYVLIANKDFSAQTLAALIESAKAQPSKINYASMGVGGAGHVIMELMTSLADIKLTHIPYKNGALIDVIGGQVPLIFQPTTTALEQIKKGNVVGLGVTSETRLPLLPGVPSIREVVPGYLADGWQGMMAPAQTPTPIIDLLNKEIAAVLAAPATVERFRMLGIEAWPSTPKKMEEVIAADIIKWGNVIKKANIQAQ
jgi:tripartite-type tricarboxylate transporter receptor subunit TctC